MSNKKAKHFRKAIEIFFDKLKECYLKTQFFCKKEDGKIDN